MNIKVKRVPLDFDYPINIMPWKGYHNPYSGLPCVQCDGTGKSFEEIYCRVCDGHGIVWPDEKYRSLAAGFKRIEPPHGPGYQLWVYPLRLSQARPISPVFPVPSRLASWLAENNASAFYPDLYTQDQWDEFIRGENDEDD